MKENGNGCDLLGEMLAITGELPVLESVQLFVRDVSDMLSLRLDVKP